MSEFNYAYARPAGTDGPWERVLEDEGPTQENGTMLPPDMFKLSESGWTRYVEFMPKEPTMTDPIKAALEAAEAFGDMEGVTKGPYYVNGTPRQVFVHTHGDFEAVGKRSRRVADCRYANGVNDARHFSLCDPDNIATIRDGLRAAVAERDAALARVKELEAIAEAARGLCFGIDWNKGTQAITHGYRKKLLCAVATYYGDNAPPEARSALKGADHE